MATRRLWYGPLTSNHCREPAWTQVERSAVKSRSVMASPTPETEIASPTRASVAWRLARSSTGFTGAGGGFLKSCMRTSTSSAPRTATSINVIMVHPALRLGLFAGLLASGDGAGRRSQFLGEIRRRRRAGLLALLLQRFELGIHAVAAELGELLFEVVILAGGGELIEGLGGGFFARHGFFELAERGEGVIGVAHARHG